LAQLIFSQLAKVWAKDRWIDFLFCCF